MTIEEMRNSLTTKAVKVGWLYQCLKYKNNDTLPQLIKAISSELYGDDEDE